MPRFSKHAYEVVAEVMAASIARADLYDIETLRRLVNEFARVFELDNRRFSYGRFVRACGLLEEPEPTRRRQRPGKAGA